MSDPVGLIGAGNGIPPVKPQGPSAPGPAGGPTFKEVLLQNIEQVAKLEQDANRAVEDLHTGRRTDLEGVLIATQKADTAFQTLQAVRNRVMQAYEELKQLRV